MSETKVKSTTQGVTTNLGQSFENVDDYKKMLTICEPIEPNNIKLNDSPKFIKPYQS